MQTFYDKVTWGQALFLFRFVDKIPAGARNRECMRTAKIGPDLRLTIKNSRSHNWDRPLIISNNLHSISFPHFLFLLCRIMPSPHYTEKCLLRRENHTEEVLFTNKVTAFFFDALSVMEWSCAAPISKVERHISYRFCTSLWCSVNRYSERSGSEQRTSHYLSPGGGGGVEVEDFGGSLDFYYNRRRIM